MRRLLTVLAGLTLMLPVVALSGVAQAAPAETTFEVAIVVGEGPDQPAGRFEFSANLVSGSDPVADAPVTLLGRAYGASSYSTLATATTGSDGYVHATAVLQRTTRYEWVYAGDATHAATTSSAFTQNVGTRVRAHAHDTSLRGRQPVVVDGRTSASKAGQRVSLWRGDVPCLCAPTGHTTARIGVATVRADGTFRLTARFARPGAKQLFVKVEAGHGTTAGYSRYLRIRVR